MAPRGDFLRFYRFVARKYHPQEDSPNSKPDSRKSYYEDCWIINESWPELFWLTLRAICCHPWRGFSRVFWLVITGFTPRAMCCHPCLFPAMCNALL